MGTFVVDVGVFMENMQKFSR